MRRILGGLAIVAVALLLSAPAHAQVAKNDNQVILNFSYLATTFEDSAGNESDSTFWNLTGTYGRFFTNHLQGAISATLSLSEFEGDSNDPSGWAGLRLDWHFNPKSTTVWYLGLQGSAYATGGSSADSETEFGWGAQGGLKAFFKQTVFFNAEVNYLAVSFDTGDVTTTSVLLGFGFNF